MRTKTTGALLSSRITPLSYHSFHQFLHLSRLASHAFELRQPRRYVDANPLSIRFGTRRIFESSSKSRNHPPTLFFDINFTTLHNDTNLRNLRFDRRIPREFRKGVAAQTACAFTRSNWKKNRKGGGLGVDRRRAVVKR